MRVEMSYVGYNNYVRVAIICACGMRGGSYVRAACVWGSYVRLVCVCRACVRVACVRGRVCACGARVMAVCVRAGHMCVGVMWACPERIGAGAVCAHVACV